MFSIPDWQTAIARSLNPQSMTTTITPRYSGGDRTPVEARISTPPRAGFVQGEYVTRLQDVIEVSIPYDALIEKGDTFTYDGKDWEVVTFPILDSEGVERQFTAEMG